MTSPSPLPAPYGPSIGLASARRVLDAAEAQASARGWPMAIAIVDTAGLLVAFHRMDGAQTGSIEIAQRKAETSARFKRPTKAFEGVLAGGGAGLKALGMEGVIPVEGGLPIRRDGAIIGGIGVSGMQSFEDTEVAEAGLAAL